MTNDEIFVDYEWGNLREIFVGLPVTKFPDAEKAPWLQEALKIFPESGAEMYRTNSGKDGRDIGKFDLMEAECQELISILERFDVVVHRPAELTDEWVASVYGADWLINGYTTVYSRDTMFVVGDNIIELCPGAPMRRAEMLAYREAFQQRIPGSGARWAAMPMVDISDAAQPGFTKEKHAMLEGGDLLAYGKTVFVGTTVNPTVGSSSRGAEWLRSYLEPQGFTVIQVPLIDSIVHLDIALSMPREGVAIVCPEAFVDGIPPQLNDWDLIEISVEQAQHDACNGLPIDSDNYILPWSDEEDGTTVQAGLEKHGITCHRIKYGVHHTEGGSVRCTTHPLRRRVA